MKVTLGYVCIPLTINITSSSTITYTNYKKDDNGNLKIDKIIKKNLEALEEILKYNKKNNIHFYRMTSNLIPLATMKEVEFDYITPYKEKYKKIGDFINKNNMRVDLHPDQFCVLNSVNPKVIENSFEILKYHKKILQAINIKNPYLILHVGSNAFGKKQSIARFKNNFNKLDSELKKMIIIENDDKIFNVNDVLKICQDLNIPMVLDYHHHCCNNEEDLSDIINDIFLTWKHTNVPPKVHFSSPKSKLKKEYRSHHDYIDVDNFIKFIDLSKEYTKELHVMLEAKKKDEALFKLIRQLKYKTDYQFVDDTTFIV